MATQKEMYELIGRAVIDARFRRDLIADTEAAVKAAGYTLTEEQLASLKTADGKGLAAVLEDRFPKSWGLPC
jgi:hypothetical protein